MSNQPNQEFINGHVYSWERQNYIALEYEGALWLYKLVPDFLAPHWPFVGCTFGWVRRLDAPDWYMISCREIGPPPKVKMNWVAGAVKPENFEHVDDNLAEYHINKTAKEILAQLDFDWQ